VLITDFLDAKVERGGKGEDSSLYSKITRKVEWGLEHSLTGRRSDGDGS